MANKDTFRLIENFVETCVLLTKPENYIRVPSGQYIERVVNTRSISDMTNEMAQELAGLPRFTAHAKVAQESEGQQVVVKHKIKTFEPSRVLEWPGLSRGFILNAD